MFKITKKDKRTNLEKEMDDLIETLQEADEKTEEYDIILSALERLVALKVKMKKPDGDKLSKDTIAVVAGNLLGIMLILNFEKTDIIRTKALGFVLKGRV